MPGQPLPDGERVPEAARHRTAQRADEHGGGDGAQQGVEQVLDEEDPDDLAGRETDGLQHGDVPQVAPDPGADGAVHGEPGGDQRAQPEQAEHLAQQPVVALRLGARLLPGGHLADRPGPEHGHRPLHRVPGVAGVGQPQPDHLPARVGQGGRQGPDQAALLTRPVAWLGAVGDAHHGQRASRAGHGQGLPGRGEQGPGETALQDHAVRCGRVQPVP